MPENSWKPSKDTKVALRRQIGGYKADTPAVVQDEPDRHNYVTVKFDDGTQTVVHTSDLKPAPTKP